MIFLQMIRMCWCTNDASLRHDEFDQEIPSVTISLLDRVWAGSLSRRDLSDSLKEWTTRIGSGRCESDGLLRRPWKDDAQPTDQKCRW